MTKYLYIRQHIEHPNWIIIGDESEIGGRDHAYTFKGAPIKGKSEKNKIFFPRVTVDIELGKNGYLRDYQVHTFIKNECTDLVIFDNYENMNTKEGFITLAAKEPDDVIIDLYERIYKEVNNTDVMPMWAYRVGPQAEAIESMIKFINSKKKEFLVNAFCRIGKCFASLEVFNKSPYHTAMFISGKTEAIREVFRTPHKCSNFTNFSVIDFNTYDELKKTNSLPSKYIITDTCQTLQNRAKKGNNIPRVNLIFFDECHFYNTININDIISTKYDKLIYMSATPAELINSGKFSYEFGNIFEYTLTDIYKGIKSGKLSANDYLLPKMFVPSIKDFINNLQVTLEEKEKTIAYFNECTNNNGFSFSSFFELTKNKKNFLHYDEVNLFAKAFANMLNTLSGSLEYDDLKNFMVFMPQIKEKTLLFKALLEKYLSGNDRVYATVDNNEGTSTSNVFSQIRSSMSEAKGLTIVLTYQRFGTGATIENLQAVVFLNDSENASVILQNLSRCLTVNGKKPYGVVIEMNLSRAIIDRYNIICSKNCGYTQMSTEEAKLIYNEMTNLMPISLIIKYGELEEKNISFDEAFMSVRKLNGQSNLFTNLIDSSNKELLFSILENIKANVNTNVSFTEKEENIKKAIKVISKQHSGSNNNKVTEISYNDLIIKIITLSTSLKQCWYYSKVKTFRRFINFYNKNEEMFSDITEIPFNDFTKYFINLINKKEFEMICNNFTDTIDIYSDLD